MRNKVLVFDDDRFGRAALLDALTEAAFDAEAVADLTAFEKARTWWKPDMVVVELSLPLRGGIEVLLDVREQDPALCTVLMAAMVPESLRCLARQARADAAFSTIGGYRGIVELVRELFARGHKGTSGPRIDE